jgi:hypothetical protein
MDSLITAAARALADCRPDVPGNRIEIIPNGLDGRAVETRNDPLYCSLRDSPVG